MAPEMVSTNGPEGVQDHMGVACALRVQLVGMGLSGPPPNYDVARGALVGVGSGSPPPSSELSLGIQGFRTPGEGRYGCFEPPSGHGPVCCLLDPLQNFCAGSAPHSVKQFGLSFA